jgi:DNA-binding NarL/FixJ family response regulator
LILKEGALMTTIAPRGASPPLSGVERETTPRPEGDKDMSIVLIDHRPLARQYLGRWLQDGSPGLRVVSLGSAADLLDSARAINAPHLIVYSIGAASVKNPEVLGRITLLRRHLGRIPLVLLSDREDVDEIVSAIEVGVRGYISTSLEVSEAAAAIQCVEAGGTYVPASALIRIAQDRNVTPDGAAQDLRRSSLESLTPRETEVLAGLRQGKPNKVIAYELKIRESTVKVFVRQILAKLHASNRTEVACLLRQQLDSSIDGIGQRQDV